MEPSASKLHFTCTRHNVTDRWISIAMLFRAWSGFRISTTPSTVHSNFSNIICPVHLRKAFRTRWQNIPIGRSWSQFSISLAAELDFNAQWRLLWNFLHLVWLARVPSIFTIDSKADSIERLLAIFIKHPRRNQKSRAGSREDAMIYGRTFECEA